MQLKSPTAPGVRIPLQEPKFGPTGLSCAIAQSDGQLGTRLQATVSVPKSLPPNHDTPAGVLYAVFGHLPLFV